MIKIVALLLYTVLLVTVIRQLPLQQLLTNNHTQHMIFGCTASIFCLWVFRTGIYSGLDVHFLWLTALTLILGFQWAIFSSALALISITLSGGESWSMLGINGLLSCALPITVSYLCYSLSFHKLPRHFFVYIFVCSFLTGAVAIIAKMFALGGYYFFTDQYSWQIITDNYLILLTLLAFPEAMLNGMTMTLMVMYKPHWVFTFQDKFYINDK
ncbi:energy-coupling factor ABC transporter permease [Alteromonadaceae bacterium BrNp21-10]|nr:energy-coupling factor ABC transporter permease [Alteromonadaceae bacterium BrNp21-10]